ncbi:hypothetical protein [Metabacillus fastidiosus]|uniref:hypothetical protein n=1 Tax=Metabacillus fastidiosus TaxID=1458 RepID=UPI002E23B11A|nr:hypothetical protein [Metabacillus fastidiosus]
MLIKAYIKRHLFHLPMEEQELLNQVEKALNKEINKENIHKLYPLTKIEDNDNILIEKQNTNIFLLNLLLSVLNHNDTEITEQEYYNESLIISKLEEETQLKLQGLPFDAVKKEIGNYLNPTSDEPRVEPQAETAIKEETKQNSYLENVEFSVDWLRGAQQELDKKRMK